MRTETVVMLAAGTAVGAYACVLMDRALRLRQQEMYMNTMVQMIHTYYNSKSSKKMRDG